MLLIQKKLCLPAVHYEGIAHPLCRRFYIITESTFAARADQTRRSALLPSTQTPCGGLQEAKDNEEKG